MPKLPTALDLGERPTPKAVVRNLPSGITGAEGQAMVEAGRTLGQVSNVIEREVDQVDKLRAEEAYNELVNRGMDLSDGEDGFKQKKGSDAVSTDVMGDYLGRFDKALKDTESKLSSGRQKTYLQRRAMIARTQFRENILRHLSAEGESYAQDVHKSGLETEIKSAAGNWMQPAAVAASLKRIEGLNLERAQREGWSQDRIQLEHNSALSRVHSAVISQAITEKGYDYADKYFAKFRDEMQLEDVQKAEQSLMRVQAVVKADEIMEKHGRGAKAIEAARSLEDPMIRNSVIENIKYQAAVDEELRNKAERDTRVNVFAKLEQSDPLTSPEDLYSENEKLRINRQPGLWSQIQARQRQRLSGLDIETDPIVFEELRVMMGEEPMRFMATDITKFYDKLSTQHKDYFEKSQTELRDPSKQASFATESQLLSAAHSRFALDGITSKKKREKAKAQFDTMYLAEKQEFVRQNKREPNAEEMGSIIKRLEIPFVRERAWWFDAQKRLYQIEPEDMQKFSIPEEDREEIIRRNTEAGWGPLTETQIREIYLMWRGQ